MAFKRSAVRSRLPPPESYYPSLIPIGSVSGFLIFLEYLENLYNKAVKAHIQSFGRFVSLSLILLDIKKYIETYKPETAVS